MRYIPGKIKDYIADVIYTAGSEFMTLAGVEYVGYYHIILDEKWTGTTDEDSQILIGYNSDPNWVEYINLSDFYLLLQYKGPVVYIPKPAEKDYDNGYFTRYFIKKRNDIFWPILEIDKKQYESLMKSDIGINEKYYFGIKLNWKLTGPKYDSHINSNIDVYGVYDTNERIVLSKEKEMPHISSKLRDFTEYSL